MPRFTVVRLAAACALALALSLSITASAGAKGFEAELRVIGTGGKFLAEKPVATGTTSVKTSPKATCFGSGTGGSGDPVSIDGTTALGLLARGSKSTASLSPLLISDSFDFGLALCGIGKSVAKGKASWYLKINHKSLSVGGDQAKVKPGDEVLWALAPSYPYPEELSISAPEAVESGVPFSVSVVRYNDKGKAKPAAGVTVSGASAPTAANGKTMVTLSKPRLLLAKKGDLFPSRAPVCVEGNCPAAG